MLTGTIEEFALTDVFRLLSLAHKTGRLDVERQAGTGRVYFDNGEVYYARSSLVREQLGQKLIRSGALTEGQLRRALDEHVSTGRRLGQILVASGTVSSRELEDALRAQTEDALFDLLRWERGDFRWTPGDEIDVEVPISVSVENLIMEASRRLDELDVIRRKIPSEDTVVTMASAPPEGAVEINITPEEWRVLVVVDGSRSVADIADAVLLDRVSVMRTLYGLVSAGLVEVVSTSAEGGYVDREHSFRRPDVEAPRRFEESAPADLGAHLDEPEEPPPLHVYPQEDLARGPEDLVGSSTDADEPSARVTGDDARPGDAVGTADDVLGREEEPSDLVPLDRWLEDPDAIPTAATVTSDLDITEPAVGAPGEQGRGFETSASARADEGSLEDVGEPPVSASSDPRTTSAGESAPPGSEERAETVAPAAAGDLDAEPPSAPEEGPRIDRAAVVRELAGLFSESDSPAPATPTAPEQPSSDPADRKRVEDDDQVTRGLISRLIDGVKGL